MTLQACNPILHPPYMHALTSYASLAAFTFDASTDRVGLVFQFPKAGTVDRVEFLIGTSTTWPSGGVQVGWQGLTETSTPSIPNGSFTHSVTVTVDPGAVWWNPGSFVDGGAAKRTVTKGESGCVVIAPVSGTTSFTIMRVDVAGAAGDGVLGNYPYCVTNSTGSYAAAADFPVMALFYDGESNPTFVHPFLLPIAAFGTKSLSTANPGFGGIVFQLASAVGISGMTIRTDLEALTNFALITDDAGSPLASYAPDKDRRQTGNTGFMSIMFDTEVAPTINTNYRAILNNSGSATVSTITFVTLPGAGYRAAMPLGLTACWTQSDNGTSWAETTTEVPMIGLIITSMDDGAGGGGGNTYSRGRVVNV